MSKRYAVFLTVLFCAFLGVFFAANLITPDRTFSPQENRYLTQRPSLSAEDFRMRLPLRDSGDFFTGTFMSEFEQYITDQCGQGRLDRRQGRCRADPGKRGEQRRLSVRVGYPYPAL